MPYKDPEEKTEKYREWQRKNKNKINAYNRARYAADSTKQKAASRRWIVTHREQYNERMRGWTKQNRSRLYDPNTVDGQARLDKENARKRELRLLLKTTVLTHYGNGVLRCVWPHCEITDVDMLTIDHVHNDGAQHRKQVGRGKMYQQLKAQGFPEGFQTLCANHQMKKELLRQRAEKNGIRLVA